VLDVDAGQERQPVAERARHGDLVHGLLLHRVEHVESGVGQVPEHLRVVAAGMQPEVHARLVTRLPDAHIVRLQELAKDAWRHHELRLVPEVVARPKTIRMDLPAGPADVLAVQVAERVVQAVHLLRVEKIVEHQVLHATYGPGALKKQHPPAKDDVVILAARLFGLGGKLLVARIPVGIRQFVDELVQFGPVIQNRPRIARPFLLPGPRQAHLVVLHGLAPDQGRILGVDLQFLQALPVLLAQPLAPPLGAHHGDTHRGAAPLDGLDDLLARKMLPACRTFLRHRQSPLLIRAVAVAAHRIPHAVARP